MHFSKSKVNFFKYYWTQLRTTGNILEISLKFKDNVMIRAVQSEKVDTKILQHYGTVSKKVKMAM